MRATKSSPTDIASNMLVVSVSWKYYFRCIRLMNSFLENNFEQIVHHMHSEIGCMKALLTVLTGMCCPSITGTPASLRLRDPMLLGRSPPPQSSAPTIISVLPLPAPTLPEGTTSWWALSKCGACWTRTVLLVSRAGNHQLYLTANEKITNHQTMQKF
jgi:hypothetical protein